MARDQAQAATAGHRRAASAQVGETLSVVLLGKNGSEYEYDVFVDGEKKVRSGPMTGGRPRAARRGTRGGMTDTRSRLLRRVAGDLEAIYFHHTGYRGLGTCAVIAALVCEGLAQIGLPSSIQDRDAALVA